MLKNNHCRKPCKAIEVSDKLTQLPEFLMQYSHFHPCQTQKFVDRFLNQIQKFQNASSYELITCAC